MDSTLRIKRSWLTGDSSLEYRLTRKLEPGVLPCLVDACIQHVIPFELSRDAKWRNVKGRDVHQSAADRPSGLPSRQDEILYVSGLTGISEDGRTPPAQDPFFASAYTEFAAFEGSHNIDQVLRLQSSPVLPADLNFMDLGKIVPLQTNIFRIGLEFFRSQRMTAMLGFAPVVVEGLYLDATVDTLDIKITAERLKALEPPLREHGIFKSLAVVLDEIFQFDLKADFETRTKQG